MEAGADKARLSTEEYGQFGEINSGSRNLSEVWQPTDGSVSEPSSYMIGKLNALAHNHSGHQVVETVMYAFELTGVVRSKDELAKMAETLATPAPSAILNEHEAFTARRDLATEQAFHYEELLRNTIYTNVVEALNTIYDYRLTDFENLEAATKDFKIKKTPVLHQLELMSTVHKHQKTGEKVVEVINPNTAFVAKQLVKLMLLRQKTGSI